MGGKESPQQDVIERVEFDLNILICGNYVKANIEKELNITEKFNQYEGKPYLEKCIHKYVKGWKYYLFSQDKDIGNNTFNFIEDSITKNKDYKNIIVFFSGLNEFTYKDLIKFYDEKPEIYHSNILIITKEGEPFIPQSLDLKNLNKNLIERIEIGNDIDICIHLIKVSSYCNQLGDEIGFPKNIIDERLLEKDNKLMIKDLFTFNILLCGKPGGGKSTLINRILGKKKAYAGKGSSSLTHRIVKYISDKYPIVIYDSPGFDREEDIGRIQELIKQKNESLNEEKNKIHCVFYVINAKSERTFTEKEFEFLRSLLNQSMDVYFIVTHAETKTKVKNFLGAIEVNIIQRFVADNRIADNLKKNIYPVELIEDGIYKKFGIKEVFTSLYNKYKEYKYNKKITSNNIREFNSIFFADVNTKKNLQRKLTALSQRVKANFKILAATLENSPSVKGTTNLSTALIKIISNIYNHPITTKDCLDYISSKGFTDEFHQTDTIGRTIEKLLDCIFYVNGPAAKEVESLASSLIKKYNLELDDEKKFYGILNSYNNSINFAIDSLQDIKD